MKVENSSAITAQQFDSINDLIIDAIRDIKGKNIVKIDLTKIEDAPAQFFIICEGESTVQVSSIASNIQKRIKQEWGIRNDHLEGMKESKWVLIDYFDTIVHVFYPETRSFYDIEDLWGDGHFVEYQDL
ncbi:MAG: ribosome silencing factor [Saprospiraceae bacterium]|nr:ribosome silencing factor [Saprospiraceae bacterium]